MASTTDVALAASAFEGRQRDLLRGVLLVGDRELELFRRYEENAYLARMMKLVGHESTYLYEFDGHGHGGMMEPGYHILEWWVKRIDNKHFEP